jgi:energy-converting hydrogenase A subunit M
LKGIVKDVHIDVNILRDMMTDKSSVPSEESLQQEFRSAGVKMIRLKSAKDWVGYVIMEPTSNEWFCK